LLELLKKKRATISHTYETYSPTLCFDNLVGSNPYDFKGSEGIGDAEYLMFTSNNDGVHNSDDMQTQDTQSTKLAMERNGRSTVNDAAHVVGTRLGDHSIQTIKPDGVFHLHEPIFKPSLRKF
jgi:hypothetical protein